MCVCVYICLSSKNLGELRLKEVSIGFGLATLLDHAPQHIFKVHLKDPTPGQQFYHVFGITYKKKKKTRHPVSNFTMFSASPI